MINLMTDRLTEHDLSYPIAMGYWIRSLMTDSSFTELIYHCLAMGSFQYPIARTMINQFTDSVHHQFFPISHS